MTAKKQNFKKINFNQAKFLQKTCKNMMCKNTLYTNEDFEKAWEQFEIEQSKIKNNEFVKMLSAGNLKLGACVGVWDLPAIITCKGACVGCYALKAERLYPQTRACRLRHLLHILYSMYNPLYCKAFVNNFIKNCSMYNIIRFHGSGDIFHENYFRILLKIVENCKKIKFYTYSKILDNHRIDYFNEKYKNFNIIKSIIDINNKKYINFGSIDYINHVKNELKNNNMSCYVCRYQDMEHGMCMVSCKKCLNCPHVLFQKH